MGLARRGRLGAVRQGLEGVTGTGGAGLERLGVAGNGEARAGQAWIVKAGPGAAEQVNASQR